MTREPRRWIAAAAAAVLLAACAGGNDPDAGSSSLLGKEDKQGKAAARGSKGKTKGGAAGTARTGNKPGTAIVEGGGAGGSSGGDDGSSDEPREIAGIDPSVARSSATVEEPEPDAKQQGIAPDYPEVLKAEIQGLGDDFRITLTFGGNLPERMDSDKTFMIAAVGITYGDDGYQVGGRADQNGWRAYAGGKFERVDFPGTFEVEGDTITMVIPWKFIHGPREFDWYVVSSWYKQLANTTHYKIDQVPNEGTTHFPG